VLEVKEDGARGKGSHDLRGSHDDDALMDGDGKVALAGVLAGTGLSCGEVDCDFSGLRRLLANFGGAGIQFVGEAKTLSHLKIGGPIFLELSIVLFAASLLRRPNRLAIHLRKTDHEYTQQGYELGRNRSYLRGEPQGRQRKMPRRRLHHQLRLE
jgi:hypothetical protein